MPFFSFLTSVAVLFIIGSAPVSAATSGTLNFQGRLTTNTGGLVSDGSYNIEFKLYDDDVAGSNLWTENRTGGNQVTVRNGYFSVYLGEVTPFGASIPWDQELWLTMNVEADGEMSPRFKLTAVPYAFRAGAITDAAGNAFTGDDLIQKSPSTVQAVNSALAAIRLNQAGSGSLLQLQGDGVDVFTVDKTGNTALTGNLTVGGTNTTNARLFAEGSSVIGTGTMEIPAFGGSAIGTGTSFTTEVAVGDVIYANSTPFKILAVNSDSSLTLSGCLCGGAPVGSNYEIRRPIINLADAAGTPVFSIDGMGGYSLGASDRTLGVDTRTSAGTGYQMILSSGTATNGNGGVLALAGGAAGTTGVGGSVVLFGGAGAGGGDNGDVVLANNSFFQVGTVKIGSATGTATLNVGSSVIGQDLLKVTDQTATATDVLLITDGGATTFRNQTDSTSAFSVQNAAGTPILTVDTVNNSVNTAGGLTVGNSSTTTAGTIRWSGADLEVYNGSGWVSLTSGSSIPGDPLAATFYDSAGGSTIGVGTFSTINLDSTLSNSDNTNISLSADEVTVLQDGYYQVAYQVTATLGGGQRSGFNTKLQLNTGSGFSDVAGSQAYHYGRLTSETTGTSTATVILELSAGDVIRIQGQGLSETFNTVANGSTLSISLVSSVSGGGGSGTSFEQNGNDFGVTAILGTTDNQGLTFITNNTDALTITNTGNATFANGLTVASGGLDLTGNIELTGNVLLDGDITDSGALTISSGGSGDLMLNSSNGLEFVANTNTALTISNTGFATFTNDLTISGGGLNLSDDITSTSGLTLASGGGGDLTLDSASDILLLSDATIRRVASGTTVIDLADTATTTLEISNSGASQVAGLTVEGDVVGASFTGTGTGLTDLNGTEITSGTIPDARLSGNVALLNANQTFSGLNTFTQGLILGSSTSTTPGAIRWSGTDFEGYDGIQWASLTTGGSGPTSSSPALTTIIKTADEQVVSSTVLQNDNELFFPVGGNESWVFRFVVQANVNTAPDIKFAVTAPVGAVCDVSIIDSEGAVNVSNIACGASQTIAVPANASDVYEVIGSVRNGATPGNITLQWAQNSSSATPLTVYAGSSLTASIGGGGLQFLQGGNSFGGTAIIGTSDNNGLNFITNNTTALSLTTSNQAIFAGEILANGGFTIAGDTLTDLTGAGLTNTGGALSLDTASANGVFVNNGNAFAGLATLGTTNNNGLSFITNNVERARFTNNGEFVVGAASSRNGELVDINGTLRSNKYILGTGPDLSLIPIVGGQSVASSWWGLQLVGNRQANVDYTPTNIGAAGSFSVAIPNQQAASVGLLVVGQTGQSADLIRLADSANNTLSAFDSNGQLILGRSSGLTGQLTFNNASNSNTFVLSASTVTGNRTVNLPDESGTVCLSDSTNCGFLPFATGTYVTDATTNNAIAINKTGASGNIISLQKNGGAVFTVANTGALQIQSTDSTALDIRNVGGTSYFSVDTSTGQVRVGSSTADAVGVLFVLDTKNSAGDPTGTDGGIYYNSNIGKFRCYEDGIWKDCIGARQVRSFIDTTADAAADNNTTNYWDTAVENNNSVPNLSPSTTNKSITGSVTFETQSSTAADRSIVTRVERSIGAPAACNSGTPVGTILSTFTTNNGEQASNTMIFLDSPNTTSVVYYTLCADSATNNSGGMTINRIRITLEEANNSN